MNTYRFWTVSAITLLCALMFSFGGNVGTSGAECFAPTKAEGSRS